MLCTLLWHILYNMCCLYVYLCVNCRYTQRDLANLCEQYLLCRFYRQLHDKQRAFVFLDPCSCSEADAARVGGHSFGLANLRFSKSDSALSKSWHADMVMMNPPSNLCAQLVGKMLQELTLGHFRFGVMLLHGQWHSEWYRRMMRHPGIAGWIPLKRLQFIRGGGTREQPTNEKKKKSYDHDPCLRVLIFLDLDRIRGTADPDFDTGAHAKTFFKDFIAFYN
jgi:hypothetical protein